MPPSTLPHMYMKCTLRRRRARFGNNVIFIKIVNIHIHYINIYFLLLILLIRSYWIFYIFFFSVAQHGETFDRELSSLLHGKPIMSDCLSLAVTDKGSPLPLSSLPCTLPAFSLVWRNNKKKELPSKEDRETISLYD